eukprot:TRINITY_DN776_c0_g2_i4.p1 TRINITY_DN776_c0_g2~~TRINITY_DN776_c0_g2_i4.p1  ORF type:complete len:306 (+),score=35.30 TRINITY_DN776_c0_g2_i4:380-1297(+)
MQPAAGVVPPPPMGGPGMDPQKQQQQWMMMQQQAQPQTQPQPQMPPPSAGVWPPQPQAGPPPPVMPPQPYPQQTLAQPVMPQPQQLPQTSSADETRTLWVGDLQYWMDETYLHGCFAITGEVVSTKVIRNKQTQQSEGYGFVEFNSHAAAERALQSYNGIQMPNTEQYFRLNWAGAPDKRQDGGPEFHIFVGDLAADVNDFLLQETFRSRYPSVKGAKVMTDRITGRSKGYGFVKFGDENEQTRAITEMNGVFCSSRPMRTGPAVTKKPASNYSTQQFNQKGTFEIYCRINSMKKQNTFFAYTRL